MIQNNKNGTIEKFISPLIEKQFPSFYRSEGPNFVAFVRAYYEWLEQTGNITNKSRSLLEYADIDETEEEFIQYFRNTYMNNIPANVAADQRLLTKHILDLYRSKGSTRAAELLFRLVFNEDIEIAIPGDLILRPSDGAWFQANYIETTSHPDLERIVGRTIFNSNRGSSAIVESISKKIIDGESVNIIFISEVSGAFKYGDRIICDGVIEIDDAPVIIGSLTAIPIENGGFNYRVGDILDVLGSGAGGKARVARTRDENGRVSFTLVNGGTGYTLDSVITVATTLVLTLSDINGPGVQLDTSLLNTRNNANGTIVDISNNVVTLINFGNSTDFLIGDPVTDGTTNAIISEVFGGGGAGATFTIGDLINREVVQINLDDIQDYLNTTIETQVEINTGTQSNTFAPGADIESSGNIAILQVTYLTANNASVGERFGNTTLGIANLNVYISDGKMIHVTGSDAVLTNANLVQGAVLTSNISSSVAVLDITPLKETVFGRAVVFSSNSTTIVANVSNDHVYFVPGSSVIVTSDPTTNAIITSQTSMSDWFFPSRTPTLLTNLESQLNETLIILTKEMGTISFLTNINPGFGYSSPPYVTVVDPDVIKLREPDGSGNFKGNNAIVTARVGTETGIIQAVEVYNSGYGYVPGESVVLAPVDQAQAVTGRGIAVVENYGTEEGRWRGNKGFLSDLNVIQDSDFYQVYSYEIIAKRMLDSYRKLVSDTVHPVGYKLFGRYRYKAELQSNARVASSSISRTEGTFVINSGNIHSGFTFTRSQVANSRSTGLVSF